MMPEPGVEMKISTLWEERKVIFTPMEHGLRASGIAEFAVRDAPPRYALLPAGVGASMDDATLFRGSSGTSCDAVGCRRYGSGDRGGAIDQPLVLVEMAQAAA